MKKASKSSKKRKPPDRAPARRAGVTELTEQVLKQVQGGLTPGVYVIRSDIEEAPKKG